MKTDISLPSPLYETSEQLAQQLGISLSEFFLAALTAYIAQYQKGNVTEQLNQVYQTETSGLDPVLATMQAASGGVEVWE